MLNINYAIATSFYHLDFIVESFNELNGMPINEIIDDFLQI